MFSLRRQLLKAANAASAFQMNNASTFRASDIKVTLTQKPMPKPDPAKLVWGNHFSDHMLIARWTSASGWGAPEIKPMGPISLHPGCKVFHYAPECFEGMKAYNGVDGIIRMFRPEMNAKRMLTSCERACLPDYDPDEFVKCVKRLVEVDADWVPPCERDLTRSSSLYIRPLMMGTDPTLGVCAGNDAIFLVLPGPTGPYFRSGLKPVSLLADPSMVRSWLGGTGYTKMGCNYAPTMFVAKKAAEFGCQQVLWLFGPEHNITEVGAMNVFMVLRDKAGKLELVTPPNNGLILPGVTRDSIIELAHDWPDIKVSERNITMDELAQLSDEKRVVEVFCCGTGAVVCPVGEIVYNSKRYSLLPPEGYIWTQRAMKEITGIQFGKLEYLLKKPHWVVNVC